MTRYIDAEKLKETWYKKHGITEEDSGVLFVGYSELPRFIDNAPTVDVRKNVHAKKVIGGGERDGATCWFECSHCHGSVDILDAYCKHCGAVLELENDL